MRCTPRRKSVLTHFPRCVSYLEEGNTHTLYSLPPPRPILQLKIDTHTPRLGSLRLCSSQITIHWIYAGPYWSRRKSSSGFICLHTHPSIHPSSISPVWSNKISDVGCEVSPGQRRWKEEDRRDRPGSSCHTCRHPISVVECVLCVFVWRTDN